MKKEKLNYIVYKTTNLINNKYYIGQHQTTNINDGYLGSGDLICYSINKHGRENFKREILFNFDNFDEMNEKEKELVTLKEVKDPMCYNMIPGGQCNMKGMTIVKDTNNKIHHISNTDPRYLSGELININTGKIVVYNKIIMKNESISSDDFNDEIYQYINKDRIIAKDINGNNIQVSKDEFNKNENLVGVTKDMCSMKNIKTNENILVKTTDPRILTGEVVGVTTGHIIMTHINGSREYVKIDDPRIKSGELCHHLKNYISCTNGNENKKLLKTDPLYLSGEFYSINMDRITINKNDKIKRINKNILNTYINDGWKIGGVKVKIKRCWINKDRESKLIDITTLKDYKDWKIGRK